MQQIETEFESKRVEADRLARRALTMARIRKAAGVLLLLGVFGAAFAFRGDIEGFISAKIATPQAGDQAQAQGQTQASAQARPSTPKAAAAASFQKAQENAKTRDALVDSLAK